MCAVLDTVQINFHAMDVNKYRYIQTHRIIDFLRFIGHVYIAQCGVLCAEFNLCLYR